VQLRVASAGVISQVRWLNLHEFHSKKMMKDGNITVQRFRMAESVDDAMEISKTFSALASFYTRLNIHEEFS